MECSSVQVEEIGKWTLFHSSEPTSDGGAKVRWTQLTCRTLSFTCDRTNGDTERGQKDQSGLKWLCCIRQERLCAGDSTVSPRR
jgi:hypothetical protein